MDIFLKVEGFFFFFFLNSNNNNNYYYYYCLSTQITLVGILYNGRTKISNSIDIRINSFIKNRKDPIYYKKKGAPIERSILISSPSQEFLHENQTAITKFLRQLIFQLLDYSKSLKNRDHVTKVRNRNFRACIFIFFFGN